jgi:hypothetical protein
MQEKIGQKLKTQAAFCKHFFWASEQGFKKGFKKSVSVLGEAIQNFVFDKLHNKAAQVSERILIHTYVLALRQYLLKLSL